MSRDVPVVSLPLAGRDGKGGAAGPRPATLAQTQRRQSTAPERRLWRLLFPFRTAGFHFRKQMQVGSYVVDFACLHAGLIIELDGDTHGSELASSNDAARDDYLHGRGFQVLRLTNDDVLTNPEGTYTVIADALSARRTGHRTAPPSPTLPARGRVPAGAKGTDPDTNAIDTSPLAGEVGRGEARGSNPREAH